MDRALAGGYAHPCDEGRRDVIPAPPAPPRLQWTKPSFVFGVITPNDPRFDSEDRWLLQKAFFDLLWEMPLAQVIETLGDSRPRVRTGEKTLAERLNQGNAEHMGELRSFEHTYALESGGAADVYAEAAANIARAFQARATGEDLPVKGEPWLEQVRIWRNCIAHILQHKNERTSLPTLHVNTCMHANLRWQKREKFEDNDLPDFHHASAALPYCHLFFTERGLKARITTKKLSLDKVYSCRVASNVVEAIELLRATA